MAATIESLLAAANTSIRFPYSAMRIAERARDDEATNAQLADLIEQDPAFSMRLLMLVNSPAFGMVKEIESIQDALAQVGRNAIAELALVQASASAFNVLESQLMRATTFWEHSQLVAALARDIAVQVGQAADTAFISGLLHDIGLLLMFHEVAHDMNQVLEYSLEQHVELTVSEQHIFGFDHAQLGAALAEAWHLPQVLRVVMRYHHQPAEAEQFAEIVACVALANEVASDPLMEEPKSRSVLVHFEEMFGCDPFPVLPLYECALKSVSRYMLR
ncbi:MAG: HDOD domain-containing protein [bacterium]